MQQNKAFFLLMPAGYYEQNINYTLPKVVSNV